MSRRPLLRAWGTLSASPAPRRRARGTRAGVAHDVSVPHLRRVHKRGDKPRLGEVLLRSGAITAEQLTQALERQQVDQQPLGEILVALGFVTDDTMRQALGRQSNVSFIDLDRLAVDKSLARVINASYARRNGLVPVAQIKQTLTVCMDDPTNRTVRDDLTRSTGLSVTVVTASHDAIGRAQARLYDEPSEPGGKADTVDLLVEEAAQRTVKSKYVEDYVQDKKADALVRRLLATAISQRASDIHLETLVSRMQIRFRIDGVLETLDLGELQDACNLGTREIVSRLKILAKLDIAERRRPQDGAFRVRVDRGEEQHSVDLRVSIVPTYYGESVVLRLLDHKHAPRSIDQLQFPHVITAALRQLLQRPSGILLVTGPTGSGKSTTLYASLMTIYRPQIRVVTAEDPIEYVYEQFSQSEVNAEIGNTFANYLRAFLRHDPEVIMVGEIRDEDTAQMSFRAAQTGHFLLSTLHTETAVASVSRLIDLRVDANTIASTLTGVLGQRLVRQVCSSCHTSYEPPADLLREFFPRQPKGVIFRKGAGCPDCNFTGYRGRAAIVELWMPDDEDIRLIAKNASFDQVRVSARRTTVTMGDAMMGAIEQGRTTLEELIRVMPASTLADFRHQQSLTAAAVSA
jgi:type IV pilus assembly protein PilB